ncbi:MAG: dinitrogenase iron-molybdenum cofactor biosynthesis protein [Oscillospiraceae bacterium]|nr:dinitrogenase iron-molybdenum cofactor biosynthesis protein [Oscillospiraceae bacterium]
MAIRAAAASTDGKVINLHFGKADRFLIFELADDGFHYIETREITPCCNRGEHEDSAFENAANALYDCKIILVSKIGIPAACFLENRGFEIYESPFPIHSVLEKLKTEV